MHLSKSSLLIGVALLSPAGAPTVHPVPASSHVCVVDGLKFSNVESAIAGCTGAESVVIPPTYTGSDSWQDKGNVSILDFRHPETVKGLTPVTEFGAKGDAVSGRDGASQSGSARFMASSSPFVKGRDEGKSIVITGAGPENGSLTTSIKTVESRNRVVLGVAAGFTAKGLAYWFGTENTTALQAAYSSQKLLFLPAGRYLMTGTVQGLTPLFLTGSGPNSVIVDDTTVFSAHGIQGHFLDNFSMQAATSLTVLPLKAFPTRCAGTPVALDRRHTGIGYQPEVQDWEIWSKLSKQQQAQQIGPAFIMSSDDIHVYRITGDLISILLFDVQFSEVALCDFRGGKNFVGGIALWHTPHDGRANKHDSIHDNVVRFPSFSGVAWAAAEDVSIKQNVVEYGGESGVKNYSSQSDGTYNTRIEVVGNISRFNHFDGMDMSESYPHTNSQQASSIVSRNTSSFNDRTGMYGDGLGWKLLDNVFEKNGLTGMSLDVSGSVISGNTVSHNNTLHDKTAHQILLGPGRASVNNVVERNRIVGDRFSGAAIKWPPSSTGNQLRDNTATGGASFELWVPPASSFNNSDSRGPFPNR